MKYSMKILSAIVVSATVISGIQAKPGKSGNGSGGGRPSGGTTSFKQGSPMQSQQPKPFVKSTQLSNHKVDHVVRQSQVKINHVNHSFKYSIAHCPTTSYKQFGFGYCFHGKSCNHWEYKCWAPSYGCYTYYCPYTYCEYWLCVEDDCYYPVSYCPVAYRVKYKFGG